VTFVVGIILARLLSPSDYGIIGLTGIFTAICKSFIDGGFGNALLRKKGATEDDFNTVFLINLGMSVFLYWVLFFSAPYIAKFFSQNILTDIIRVTSVSLIISSIGIVQRIKITKRIDFKTQAIITLVSQLSSGIVGIIIAFSNCGVWSLVVMSIVGSFLTTIFMFCANKWIPKFYFSLKSFRELFGYGSKILASSLLDCVWKEIYQVVIGKCYSPTILGYYSRAKGYSTLFSSNLTGIVQRVTFPVLSELQDDKERLKDCYRKIIKVSMLVTFISMFLLIAVSKSLIVVMIGNKWIESAKYLQIISLGGMLYPLHAINLNILQVLGRSDLFLKLEI